MKKTLFILTFLLIFDANAQISRKIDLGFNLLSPQNNAVFASPGFAPIVYSLKNHGPDTIYTTDSFYFRPVKDPYIRTVIFSPKNKINPGDSIIIDDYKLPLIVWKVDNAFLTTFGCYVIGGLGKNIVYETGDNQGMPNAKSIFLKLVKNTSVNDLELFNQINLYPNPTSGIFSIENKSDATIERVEVFNAMGQLLQSSNVSSFDMSGFANGHYLVKIHTKQSVVFKRIVLNQ